MEAAGLETKTNTRVVENLNNSKPWYYTDQAKYLG